MRAAPRSPGRSVTPRGHTSVMVVMEVDRMPEAPVANLNSASPVGGPAVAGDRPARSRPLHPGGSYWQPLAGTNLLDRLRVTGRRRPRVDTEMVGRLRSGLEDRLSEDRADPSLSAPVVVSKDRLTGILACEGHRVVAGHADRTPTTALACGALVDTLFRQLITTGTIGDPMGDGVAALAVDDRHQALVSWIEGLGAADRAELQSEVSRQAEGLQCRWPALDPGWLPRTQQAMRVPLVDGAVLLSARVDLVVGRPAEDEASVAIVEVKSGARQLAHRADLHFYALVETLRSSAPPFVVATYYTRTGELDVEAVTGPLLFAAAHRTVTGARLLREEARGMDGPRRPHALCVRCAPQDLELDPVTRTVPTTVRTAA